MKTIINVERRRLELNLTQAQLAEMAGVTQGAISMIERGERTPSLDVMMKIADALGCTIDELIRKEESA